MAFRSIPAKNSGFVWEENGQIIGNLSLIPSTKGGRRVVVIANVAVHPDHRRRGIAHELTQRALQTLRQQVKPKPGCRCETTTRPPSSSTAGQVLANRLCALPGASALAIGVLGEIATHLLARLGAGTRVTGQPSSPGWMWLILMTFAGNGLLISANSRRTSCKEPRLFG